jgi:hypothetical protein
MLRFRIPAILATAAVAVLLTGCAGGAPAPSPSPSPTASPTATPTPTPAAASTDPNAPANQCADDAISVAITGGDAGAGSIGYDLVFTNTGESPCELRGAPGVSVVDAAGTQLGAPADQIGDDAPETLTIQPGASVSSQLTAVNIAPGGGPLDDCPVVEGTGYRVYPPHSFTGFIVAAANTPACDSSTVFLKVGPVQAQDS